MSKNIPVSYTHLDVYKRQDFTAILQRMDLQGIDLPGYFLPLRSGNLHPA